MSTFQEISSPSDKGRQSGLKPFIKAVTKPPVRLLGGALVHHVLHDSVPMSGGILIRVPHDMDGIACAFMMAGRYERSELEILKRGFGKHDKIIEIGGNIGYIARFAFENNLRDGGRYVCVEPNPAVQDALAENLARGAKHHAGRAYQIIAAAICEPGKEGEAVPFFSRRNLSSGLVGQISETKDGHIVHVPTASFSSIVRQHAPKGAALICDAEGAEIDMVQKEPHAFDSINKIAIEFHEPRLTGRSETPDDMVAAFEGLSFRVQTRIKNCFLLDKRS